MGLWGGDGDFEISGHPSTHVLPGTLYLLDPLRFEELLPHHSSLPVSSYQPRRPYLLPRSALLDVVNDGVISELFPTNDLASSTKFNSGELLQQGPDLPLCGKGRVRERLTSDVKKECQVTIVGLKLRHVI